MAVSVGLVFEASGQVCAELGEHGAIECDFAELEPVWSYGRLSGDISGRTESVLPE